MNSVVMKTLTVGFVSCTLVLLSYVSLRHTHRDTVVILLLCHILIACATLKVKPVWDSEQTEETDVTQDAQHQAKLAYTAMYKATDTPVRSREYNVKQTLLFDLSLLLVLDGEGGYLLSVNRWSATRCRKR